MDAVSLTAALEVVCSVERGVGDEADNRAVLGAGRRLRAAIDACEQIATLNLAALASQGRSAPVAETLRDHGRSSAQARAAGARAATCETHPGLHDALASGVISTGHVDAFNRACAGITDTTRAQLADRVEDLVAAAGTQSVDEFARACRDAVRAASDDDGLSVLERQRAQRTVDRWVDRDTGMHHTKITLDPVTDEQLWATINATVRRAAADPRDDGRSWTHRSVDTIVSLVTRHGPHAGPADPSLFDHPTPTAPLTAGEVTAGEVAAWCDPVKVPQISILVDWDHLAGLAQRGAVCETLDGTPVPIATVRRLCCRAGMLPIVLDGDGRPLDVGSARRLATTDQRRALAAMYATCGYPRCPVPLTHCDVHHVTDWTRHHGLTDLDNLLPICHRHHHLIHEGGWTLTMTPDRAITTTRPDGTITHRTPDAMSDERPTDAHRSSRPRALGHPSALAVGPTADRVSRAPLATGRRGQPPLASATLVLPAEIHGIIARRREPTSSIGWSLPSCCRRR